ncbi:hypothetical protein NESM_000556300 [Novymonas esmeraldas]|uniref:Uncharacterized protein n=1 Tax=Novymonas esmeraldas TaxID=1808958 RepID=A0AAW0EPW3_9TRYP
MSSGDAHTDGAASLSSHTAQQQQQQQEQQQQQQQEQQHGGAAVAQPQRAAAVTATANPSTLPPPLPAIATGPVVVEVRLAHASPLHTRAASAAVEEVTGADRGSGTDDSAEGGDVCGTGTPRRVRRRSTRAAVLNYRRRGGSSNPSSRAPRALSAGLASHRAPPTAEVDPFDSLRSTSSLAVAAAPMPTSRGFFADGDAESSLPPPLSASATMVHASAVWASSATTRSLPTPSHVPRALALDTRMQRELTEESMSPIAPTVSFPELPTTPSHRRTPDDQPRQSPPLQAAQAQSIASYASAPQRQLSPTPSQRQPSPTPSQRQLSPTPSQRLRPARGTGDRSPLTSLGTDHVFRTADHIVVDNTEFAITRVLPQRRRRGSSSHARVGSRSDDPGEHSVAGASAGDSSARTVDSHTRVQEVSRNTESAEEIGWRGVAHFASLVSAIPPVTDTSSTGLALLQQVRIATAEERRVRLLYHTRPHVALVKRPRVVSNIVQDRTRWEQPLCYAPLCFPCMRNTFYSVPLSTVMRTSWEPDLPGPSQPSLAFSDFDTSALSEARQHPQQQQQQQHHHHHHQRDGAGVAPPGTRANGASTTAPTPTVSAVYHVPITAPRLSPANARSRRTRGNSLLHRPQATEERPNPLSRAAARAPATPAEELFTLREETARLPVQYANNCSHLLYRFFCVRCAIASQAQALQADADMRSAMPTPFPCCSCLQVESRSYSAVLCAVCLLDLVTLGVPFGCCCYHGVGSALYGWHLRYLLRARYRIFAWTAVDLLTMCCIPGLALDQQGAELLLNGTPETTVALQFME